jgi:hypothetical protein
MKALRVGRGGEGGREGGEVREGERGSWLVVELELWVKPSTQVCSECKFTPRKRPPQIIRTCLLPGLVL